MVALGFLGLTETMPEEDPHFPAELPAEPERRAHWMDRRITESLRFREPAPKAIRPVPELAGLDEH